MELSKTVTDRQNATFEAGNASLDYCEVLFVRVALGVGHELPGPNEGSTYGTEVAA